MSKTCPKCGGPAHRLAYKEAMTCESVVQNCAGQIVDLWDVPPCAVAGIIDRYTAPLFCRITQLEKQVAVAVEALEIIAGVVQSNFEDIETAAEALRQIGANDGA